MANQYEIEIKSLLGSSDKAQKLRDEILKQGGELMDKNSQLNHYFLVEDTNDLEETLISHIEESKKESFKKILEKGEGLSVRTRELNGKVILVIKASIGDDSSSNGVSRMEFESEIDMSLSDLDQLLLSVGLKYQAKWSRLREEYKLGDTNICIDKNAGYGYVAEFEKVVEDPSLTDSVKSELLDTMRKFEVEELSQDRLERMFSHYNQNWQDYYGTDNIFNIE